MMPSYPTDSLEYNYSEAKIFGSCGALLVDLSKAFDCIVHDLLLAKLSAYGFDYKSLKLINNFLSGRKFRTKIGSSYSPYLIY